MKILLILVIPLLALTGCRSAEAEVYACLQQAMGCNKQYWNRGIFNLCLLTRGTPPERLTFYMDIAKIWVGEPAGTDR